MISKPAFVVALLCTGAVAAAGVRYQRVRVEAAAGARRVAELEKRTAALARQTDKLRAALERPELARQLDRVGKLSDAESTALASENVKLDPAFVVSDLYVGWPITIIGSIEGEMDRGEAAKATDGGRVFVVQTSKLTDPTERVWYVGLRKAPEKFKEGNYFMMFHGLHAGVVPGLDGAEHPVLAARWGIDMAKVSEDMERQKVAAAGRR